MGSTFTYLLDKIRDAPFSAEPFRHVEIQDFLSPEHFSELCGDPQIHLPVAERTEDLIEQLGEAGYKLIPFPGCVTSADEYLRWFNSGWGHKVHGATESFGIVYRLADYRGSLLTELSDFMNSYEAKEALVEKFQLDRPVTIDYGVQKYLHGYEISPHPDIRQKALTWMLNLNPGDHSEDLEIHTHYLRLKKEWAFIGEFWRGNPTFERDWLPWAWCETIKQQRRNNSIVIFSPANDTIHAVKANYDHLQTQRTQLYGNLWYEPQTLPKVDFARFNISGEIQSALERTARTPATVQQLKTFYWAQLSHWRNLRQEIDSVLRRHRGLPG